MGLLDPLDQLGTIIMVMIKVIIDKSRGDVSLLEQDTIENVS